MTKARSPNYPGLDLEKAVLITKKLYQAIKFSTVSSTLAMQQAGYNVKGGAGRRTLAALKSYGLINLDGSLDGEGDQKLQLSEIAKPLVIEQAPENQKRESLKKAVLGPKLFHRLWDQFSETELSAQGLEWHLVSAEDFTAEGAKAAIEVYNNSIAYAGLREAANAGDSEEEKSDTIHQEPEKPTGAVDNDDLSLQQRGTLEKLPRKEDRSDVMEVSTTVDSGTVSLRFPAHLSADDYEDIKAWFSYVTKKMERLTGAKTPEEEAAQ